jgi:ABC-type lipoprotein release transport system permease subunit
MNFFTLIRRSLRFHARQHLGVVLGAAIGSAALIGALIVGDSVRGSLRERALDRLGETHFALVTGDRFFERDLADRLAKHQGPQISFFGGRSAALLLLGTAARQDGQARVNQVNIIGVDTNSWPALAHWPPLPRDPALSRSGATGQTNPPPRLTPVHYERWCRGELLFPNETLARQLALREGDSIVVRVRKPSALALDAVITPRDDQSVAFRLEVGPVLTADLLGDFSLSANQVPPANAFLPLNILTSRLAMGDRANLVLNGSVRLRPQFDQPAPPEQARAFLDEALASAWRLEDAQIAVSRLEPTAAQTGGELLRPVVEVRTPRIFLDSPVVDAATTPRTRVLDSRSAFPADNTNDVAFSQFVTNGVKVLTYLANLIQVGDRATPYSMVTAADSPYVPDGTADDEILVNEWLAEDLQVKPGDTVQLSYYVVDSGSRLLERTNAFRVRSVLPLRGRYADRTLMPEFPGLAKAESTRDWDAGFPLVHTIRDKDEDYWKKHRGTPKAFITLAAGQKMWGNRFGELTAIRYEVPTNSSADVWQGLVYRNALANLAPADVGLRFEPVRERALRAVEQAQDFGGLFIGFSFFLVIAALLLMALLFRFSLEQRSAEVGTFLALGFTPSRVRRLLLAEGVALSLLGGLLGALGGIVYARAMLWALTNIWRSAVGVSSLGFHVTSMTLVLGIAASTVVGAVTIWLTLRKQARQPARELLAGSGDSATAGQTASGTSGRRAQGWGFWVGIGGTVSALGMVGWAWVRGDTANAGVFFGAGSLILIAGLAFFSAWFRRLAARPPARELTLAELGVRGCARRRSRSVATVALLASGCFLISSISVFRLDATRDAAQKTSGTGGFALIGQTTLPVLQDLNTPAGREFFGLREADLEGVKVVPFRVRAGDDASCLNLNRAQKPRLLGVNPELLAGRFTFAQVAPGFERAQGWGILSSGASATPADPQAVPEIPAIGDANSIQWALGKRIGDTLDYADENGRNFRLRLVGSVANSILQGNLLIDEAEFIRLFPSESGHRWFLLDGPPTVVTNLSPKLSRALQDVGLELTSAVRRLDAFNAVQNTYLGTFQILGGLGLLLGSAGLGIVVLRNVLERRGELGLMVAVGFRRQKLLRLLLVEHGALLGLGLSLGLLAAAVAVLPALASPTGQLPYVSVSLTLAGVLLNGILWTWLATRFALRGDLLHALRNE